MFGIIVVFNLVFSLLAISLNAYMLIEFL